MGKKNRPEPEVEGSAAEAGGEAAPAPGPSAAADGEPAYEMRAGTQVAGTSETRHIASVPYCSVCSAPFEFCEWGPNFKKCKEVFEGSYRTHFPDVDGEEALSELMKRLGFEGGDAASKKAQSGKKAADPDAPAAPAPGKIKKGGKAEQQVVISLNNRNKKKHITVVQGLELFDVDTAAAAKVFGKKFACGSALKKGENGQPPQIEIQGNYREELPQLIADKLKLSLDDIYLVLDDKKKVRASEQH